MPARSFFPARRSWIARFSGPIVQLLTYGTVGASISLFGGFYRERTRELHENQQQLEAVFRQSSAGLVQLDADGRIVLANERFCLMTGWTADAMRGSGIRDLIAPADRTYLDESLRTVAGAVRPAPIELRALRPDGAEAWLQLALSPLGDDEASLARIDGRRARYLVAQARRGASRAERPQGARHA